MTSQRLLKGKFYSLYEDLKAHPQTFFRYFKMSSVTFDKLMDLLDPSLTFQDTRIRKPMPPEERLGVTLSWKKMFALFLIHILFIIVLSGNKSIIRPTATYGCETWAMAVTEQNRLLFFERRLLRKNIGTNTRQWWNMEDKNKWRIRNAN